MANERYKLMIVDDEYEIRQGLRSFDYSAFRIEASEDCENGLFALKALENEPADILVTDIRMPLMDGLELAEKVSSRYPHTKIIILSGYDDFEYAKKCMKHGALDYLLKPLDFEEYEKVLAKAIRLIGQEKEQQVRAAALERKAKLSAHHLRQKFLRDILQRSMTEEAIELESSSAEVMLEENGQYAVCLLRLSSYPEKPRGVGDKDWNLIVFTLDNLLQDLWDEQGMGYHYVDSDGQCSLIVANSDALTALRDNSDSLREKLDRLLSGLKRFRGLFKSHFSYVIGPVVSKPERIRLSYREAGALFHATADRPVEQSEDSAIDEGMPRRDIEQANGHRLVQEAKRFIEENFDRTITLEDVAKHVHLNASYLSFLFKEMTGQKYIDYLTLYRIDKAKAFLKQTNHKIHEVGEMVGYENPRYFTLVFKKYAQQSPVEYRNACFQTDAKDGRP
ncbi:response regulator transcription factor [Cohnella herbarum]|uniref:Response regulator n=1 Tax=Cohnella herbarum TaxID=2728023 RepID=A0A7Z2VKH3_9BACL|nr:response regulator [Cohnella herbarum]QJD84918.1 response regulator [Cohnella herbarum]